MPDNEQDAKKSDIYGRIEKIAPLAGGAALPLVAEWTADEKFWRLTLLGTGVLVVAGFYFLLAKTTETQLVLPAGTEPWKRRRFSLWLARSCWAGAALAVVVGVVVHYGFRDKAFPL